MPLEVLVHLVREAHRGKRVRLRDRLIEVLFGRCATLLRRSVRPNDGFDADTMRDEILGRFGEVVAKDLKEEGPLDFYELRFHNAFAALRHHVIRDERRHRQRFEEPEAGAATDDDAGQELSLEERLASPIHPGTFSQARQLATVEGERLLGAIEKLPDDEREAVALCHFLDLDVESTDRNKVTAATIAGVEGRTIRARLRRAATRLERFKEDT
jgi:hypothetical protein